MSATDTHSRGTPGAGALRTGRTRACWPAPQPEPGRQPDPGEGPVPRPGERRRGRHRRRQGIDRRIPVDVLHRDRRQVRTLPDPRTEMRHHQRVGAQVVEEVTVGRHLPRTHDLRQCCGEDLRETGAGGTATPRSVEDSAGSEVNSLTGFPIMRAPWRSSGHRRIRSGNHPCPLAARFAPHGRVLRCIRCSRVYGLVKSGFFS